ncbi:MAG: bifunctional riboflavin kinase/FAD synthetase [Bacteroidetes bacterium]|nr:bifunctional riboflavin kinase/FAD synthetase [Bacteroidota bacterium]
MQVHNGWENLPSFENVILTIGTYDGVHFGHQQIIKRINDLAKANQSESVLLTFHPHPRLVLRPDLELKLITTIEEKVKLLANYGIDHIVIAPFSKEFASIPAELYVKDVLVKNFMPKKIVIGYDHKFGAERKGDIDLLRKLAKDFHYEVEEISKQTIDDLSVSSTKVRKAILEGDIEAANELLAHPFSLSGEVVHGEKRGRQLGFPTANIEINNPHKLIPPAGVYAIKSKINKESYNGLLSIGSKPTFGEYNEQFVEAYFFDFKQDIYGQEIKVTLIGKVRNEMKFDSKDALVAQMKEDVKIGKEKYFCQG